MLYFLFSGSEDLGDKVNIGNVTLIFIHVVEVDNSANFPWIPEHSPLSLTRTDSLESSNLKNSFEVKALTCWTCLGLQGRWRGNCDTDLFGVYSYSQTWNNIYVVSGLRQMLILNCWIYQVCWKGGKEEAYPYVWLKDNCSCPSCYHKVSHSRLTYIEETDLNAEPITVRV